MKTFILTLLFGLVFWPSLAQQTPPVVTIQLPLNRAIYQRLNNQATFKLAGQLDYIGTTTNVAYRVEKLDKFGGSMGNYTDWTDLPLAPIVQNGGLFSHDLTLPTGWYGLQTRQRVKFGGVFSFYFSENVKVGVGESLFFAGQSNAQGFSLVGQGGTPDNLGAVYDCVSAVNQNCICKKTFQFPAFSLLSRASDDNFVNGTMMVGPNGVWNVWAYEALAKRLVDKEPGKVIPVAIFDAAMQASSIGNWKESAEDFTRITSNPFFVNCNFTWGGDGPEGQPYYSLNHSLRYYGGMLGARGVVWHQGESDALPNLNSSQSFYADALKTVIDKTRQHFHPDLGWAISKASRINNQGVDYTNQQVLAAQEQVKNEKSNTEWGAYYSDNISNRFDQTHFNKEGLLKLAELYATGTYGGNPAPPVGGNFLNLAPVSAQVAPTIKSTFTSEGSIVTLSVEGNYGKYCWVKGMGKMDACESNAPSITMNNNRHEIKTDWRCYVTNNAGSITLSQAANTPLAGLRVLNKNGLVNVSANGGAGRFLLDVYRLDWTIANLPAWASLSANAGSDGETQINVTFQANSGAARTATLLVSGNDGAGQQNVEISQEGGNQVSSCPNTGSISYQRWEDIGGSTTIQSLRNNTNFLQNTPAFTQNLNSFEAPTNILDYYGVRIRGYVCPPVSGNYTFWVAGDDNAELWLSANDQPNNLSRIAYHSVWTQPQQWDLFPTQQSASVSLQAGQRYYVEALMKERSGGDNLAVGWQLPNGTLERPIPGNRLIPFGNSNLPSSVCNFSVSATVGNANPSCGTSLTLNAPCSGSDCNGVNYTWSGNGLYQTNQSTNTNAPSVNGSYTYYVQASKTGCATQNASVALNVSGCGGGGGSSSACSAENEQCSGNSSEIRSYNVSVSTAGSYTLKALYRSHEGPGAVRWSANGGAFQTLNVAQTSVNNYVEITLGTVTLSAGNNSINLSAGSGFVCFRKICAQSGNGGGGGSSCNFTVLASNSNNTPNCGGNVTLNAACAGSDCGGIAYTWLGNGISQSGSSINISVPKANGSYNYTLTGSKAGCNNQITTTGIVVSNCGGGGDASACSSENEQCSGNQFEFSSYNVSVATASVYNLKVRYRSHESPSTIRWQANSEPTQSVSVAQTGLSEYVDKTLGTIFLNAGSNSIKLSSGGGFVCFRKVCVQSSSRVGVAENEEESSNLAVYPNPTNGELTLQMWVETRSDVRLNLHDLTGRSLWQNTLPKRQGSLQERLWLGEMSAGFYLLTVETDERSWTQKVVLQK